MYFVSASHIASAVIPEGSHLLSCQFGDPCDAVAIHVIGRYIATWNAGSISDAQHRLKRMPGSSQHELWKE
jgi:hypothetical protein